MTHDVREQAIRLAAEMLVAQLHRRCDLCATFVELMRFGDATDIRDAAMLAWMERVRFQGEVVSYGVWLGPIHE